MDEKNFSLTVCYADQCGNPQNCLYPHIGTANTPEKLKPLLCHDHVLIQFSGNRRGKENFIQAATAVFDCDNDHSDIPAEWITVEDIPAMFLSLGSCFYLLYHKTQESEDPQSNGVNHHSGG